MVSIEGKMAWRNIWRNPRRTLLTASAIAFACVLLVFMLSFQFGSYETMINTSVKIHTGHLQVQGFGYHDKKHMRMVVPQAKAVAQAITSIDSVEAVSIRAKAFSLISSNNRTYGGLVLGIDPGNEARVSTLAQTIDQGSYFPEVAHTAPSGFATAVVGRLLADNLRVHVGDEITIMGQGRDGSVAATVARVIGTFASGLDDFDRNTIVIPLSEFQSVYSMGDAAHEVVAICRSLKQVPQLKGAISQYLSKSFPDAQLAVLDWETLVPGLRQAISMDLVMGVIMYFILVIVVAFSILNTFLMAIFERTREFGVLMALGTKPGRLTRVLIAESAMLTLIGISAGILIGVFITIYFQVNGIDVSGSSELLKQYGITGRIHPRLSMFTALTGPLAVFMITLLSAMYPAFKIRKMKPLDALAHT